MASSPFQLVQHQEDCKLEKIVFPVYGEIKYDGNFIAIVVDHEGVITALTRSGLEFKNCEKHTAKFMLANSGVYIGEICCDWLSLEQLSGAINPNRVEELDEETAEKLERSYIMFHDYIPYQDFLDGYCPDNYDHRRELLENACPLRSNLVTRHKLASIAECEEFAAKMISEGREGAVFKMNADWKAGRRNFMSIKIVRQISYDLMCVGVLEGKGKRENTCAKLIMRWKDGDHLECDFGKGWTDKHRDEFLIKPPIGKIFRVTAMQYSSKNGKLRNPKVQEERHDKKEADF